MVKEGFKTISEYMDKLDNHEKSAGKWLKLIGTFTIVHALYYSLGIRFDTSLLESGWQNVDVKLLQERLLESLFYLHSQPPAYNLFLGGILKVFPGPTQVWGFQATFLLFGLGLYVSTVILLNRLGLSQKASFYVGTIFMVSPFFILYEHWLFYTFPIAALLVLSAFFLHQALIGKHKIFFEGFFWIIFVICCAWSLFHLVFFIAVVVGLCLMQPQLRRQVVLSALIPFILLLSMYLKNWFLYDQLSVSSWGGMSMGRMTVVQLSPAIRDQLISEKKVSDISAFNVFSAPEKYPPEYFLTDSRQQEIPVISQMRKSTGHMNFHHFGYIQISNKYSHDAAYVLKYYPAAYLKALKWAWGSYFRPPSQNYFLDANREKISLLTDVFESLALVQIGSEFPFTIHLTIIIGWVVVVGFVIRLAISSRFRCQWSQNQSTVMLFMGLTILYVAIVGNSIDMGENNRFRFVTDPFIFILFAVALKNVYNSRRAKSQ